MTGGRADVVLVGGGLANGLLALRLRERRPDLRVAIVEAGSTLGGNHTWSFNATDLSHARHRWLDPLVVHRWPAYEVAFPGRARRIDIGYRSVTSERFHKVLTQALPPGAIRLGVPVVTVGPERVDLADGTAITAPLVVDGRGGEWSPHLTLAFQKFVGLELRFDRPHAVTIPLLMDARVAQHDGYRFVYVLPFAPDRLLVEDTYYSDRSDLDEATLGGRAFDYAKGRGWGSPTVLRSEAGVLPILLGGDVEAFWRAAGNVPRVGLRAGLFHPTTGYSLPAAAATADLISSLPELRSAPVAAAIRDFARERWRADSLFRLLNRMLFRAGRPADRFRVLERFYGLSEPLIARFYASDLTAADKLRILAGKPPVPILGALRSLRETMPLTA